MWKNILILAGMIILVLSATTVSAHELKLDEELTVRIDVEKDPLRHRDQQISGTNLNTFLKLNDNLSAGLTMGITSEDKTRPEPSPMKSGGFNVGLGFSFSF